MLTSATKRLILPFSNPKTTTSELEAAVVFAVVELERNRGGGLISRQPEEKLVFLSKIGYPLWIYPKNNLNFIFDGFGDSNYNISYIEVPSAKTFIKSLETNSSPRENYSAFLLDHNDYFQMPIKEKQFVFKGLIADMDFRNEFSVYYKEASELNLENSPQLSPSLDENTISNLISMFGKLQSDLREEVEVLPECIKLLNKITSQYITEFKYEASAVAEETDAKIRAQEELVNPKIAKINKDYKAKIKSLTEHFDKEIENLQKNRTKTQKSIESSEGKIKLYQLEVKAQATKKHSIYEKRWKEKIKQTQRELNDLKKKLKDLQSKVTKLSKQKMQEISKLNFELDTEIKFARQPLLELKAARDAKMLTFKIETDKLLNQEKPVIEGLNKTIKLNETTTRVNFESLGIKEQGLRNSALLYVPFYLSCYEAGASKRYFFIAPSTIAGDNFSGKLKSAFGISKIKNRLIPRFKLTTTLINNVKNLAKQNTVFENQLNDLSQKNNLLRNKLFMEKVTNGLSYLKNEGWLSDKEQQALSSEVKS
jgi:hypothetical protein